MVHTSERPTLTHTLPTPPEQAELEALFAGVDQLEGCPCVGCGSTLCGHASVIAIQMGGKEAPRCPRCLAQALETPLGAFLTRALAFSNRRDCYRAAWQRASAREGQDLDHPACLWTLVHREDHSESQDPGLTHEAGTGIPEVHCDLGDEGCGDLALALRRHVSALPPGTVLVVRATDPGAEHDIPAWCGLTGHTLLRATPPTYRLRTRP